MQCQRHVLGPGETARRGRACRFARQVEQSRRLAGPGLERDHRDPERPGGADRRRVGAGLDDQRAGVEVGERNLVLPAAVGRVQRGCRRTGGDGHKGGRHLGAVREHDGDPVGPAQSQAVQGLDRYGHVLPQAAKGEGAASRRGDRLGGVCAVGDELENGLGFGHIRDLRDTVNYHVKISLNLYHVNKYLQNNMLFCNVTKHTISYL